MRTSLVHYMISLTATTVAFCLYWLLVVPILEPNSQTTAPQRPISSGNTAVVEGDKSQLTKWLPTNSWELQPCKILETSQGTIYFKDYQTDPDGTIEVFPFTMVIRSESLSIHSDKSPGTANNADRQPIILRASQRAHLQFDRPFVLGSKAAGKLQSGQLEGIVNVFQPESVPGKNNGISIWTSNVQMTPLRIFSLEDIDFNLGPHQGSGRSFNIELSHNTPLEAINTDFSKINGIKKLELAFLKSLLINPDRIQSSSTSPVPVSGNQALQPPSSFSPPESPASTVPPSAESMSGPLNVTCDGPFVFDFEQLIASFEKQVRVQRASEPGDAITGQRLDVRFDQEFDPQQTALTAEPPRADLSRLKVRSIQVTGQPAKLQLISQHAEVTAEQLEYDLVRQQVFARDPNRVLITQPEQQFQAKQIQYRLREDGSLGPLVADGPGEIQYRIVGNSPPAVLNSVSTSAATAPKELLIRWKNRLTIEPDEQQRLVTLDGGASLTLDGQQQLAGERLRLWLWMQPELQSTKKNHWTYLPIQAEVDRQVWVEHTDFAGLTHRLLAKWPLADQLEKQQIRLFRSSEDLIGDSTIDLLPPAPQFKPQTPDAPLRFASREILVRLDQSESLTQLQSVRLEGAARVDHWEFSQPNQPPTILTGGRLHLKPLSEKLFHLAVVDNARIVSADWELSGPELHFDQQANRLWINGGGQASVRGKPTSNEIVPTGQSAFQTTAAAQLAENQTIDITWKAGMIFDGEKLYFENQVTADIRQPSPENNSQTRLQSRSEALSLILESPINLAESTQVKRGQQIGNNTKIRQLILVNQLLADQRVFPVSENAPTTTIPPVVLVRQQFDSSQNLLTKQTLIAPHLDIFPDSEQFSAAGPGQIIQWQRATNQTNDSKPNFLTASGPLTPNSKAPSTQINYLHVLYDGTLSAKGKPAELQLHGRVRGLYGNVASFDTESNPDRNKPDKGLLRLSCDDLHVVHWQRRSDEQAFWELIAEGSANFVGESFEATAARMSYHERSGKLIIDGGDRGDANLWYQAIPTNPQRDHLVAEQIAYWPETQRAEIDKVRNATINRAANGSR